MQTLHIEDKEFKVACLELSLIEATMITDENGVDIQLLNKCIKKYAKILKKEIFEDLGKYKFIMSMNRLKEISRPIDTSLSLCFLNIIKRNGGLFIGE